MGRSSDLVFDDGCEVAAVVYRPGENPDDVIAAFLLGLVDRGFDVAGLMQKQKAGHCELLVVPRLPMPGKLLSVALDGATHWDDVLDQVATDAAALPDIVVLNRFGWREANGGGLLDVLLDAADRGTPVLIAVPKALFEDWLALTQGMTARLNCDRKSLDRWWNRLQRPARGNASTYCERYKD
ncbi:DUF2478 domain-containing protein, partial [Rhizobiaceae sp. 2RAB30]